MVDSQFPLSPCPNSWIIRAWKQSKLQINLQYSSQILKHLCDFLLPQCWFGYYSRLSAPKYAWFNIGEGEGYIWLRTKVSGVNVRNLEKIQDKWLLFQQFLTSIVFSWKRGNNDRFRSRWIFWDHWWKIHVFFFRVNKVKLKRKTVCWIMFCVWQNDRWK